MDKLMALSVFVEVAETGGFSSAAPECCDIIGDPRRRSTRRLIRHCPLQQDDKAGSPVGRRGQLLHPSQTHH